MNDPEGEVYEFESFKLEVTERRLLREGIETALTPKAFDLLVLLVRNHGHLMTKDAIIEELWQGSFIEEANLNVNVSALRRALGDTPAQQRFIETVPRQGYRFVAPLRRSDISFKTESSAKIGDVQGELTAERRGGAAQPDERPPSQRPQYPRRRTTALTVAVTAVFAFLLLGWLVYGSLDGVSSRPKSIAVLPFRPLSQSASDEALEMGMTDALITKLSKIDELTVRPTSAVRKFAVPYADALEAGRDLRVEAVLDGKIQKANEKVRVTVQLLRVADGATLWSESFDDYFTNIFAVQDSISERMSQSLALKLSPQEQESIEKRHTESTEAYQLYLQGQHHHLQISAEGSRKAIQYYEEALKVDPLYALAWANSVGAYAHIAGLNENREANLQKARIAAYTSLSLDPELPEAHEAVATVLDFFDWNWPEAEREYLKAIDLGPNRDGPHYAYSLFLSRFKRHEEAVREIRIAGQILPEAVFVQNQLARTLFRARRFEESLAEANRSLQMKQNDPIALRLIFGALLHMSRIEEAEAALGRLIEVDPEDADILRARFYLRTGRKTEADAIIRPLVDHQKESGVEWALAQNYMRLGDMDKTFEHLERSFQRRESQLTVINVEADWDPIRGDPRYTDLMRRIGLPP